MKAKDDLIPAKVIVDEFCVSRTTLWRASKSNIPGFPDPVIIRRLVYWRRGDLDRLEEALMRYLGRIAFERQREAQRKVGELKRAVAAAQQQRRPRQIKRRMRGEQTDLFRE